MRWSDAISPPRERTLREFAAILALVCAVLAVWRGIGGSLVVAGGYAAVAIAAGIIGWLKPRWLAPLFVAWMVVAFPVSWLVSTLLLALVYYGLVTPIGLVRRLLSHSPLAGRAPPGQDSYWEEKPQANGERDYLRQF